MMNKPLALLFAAALLFAGCSGTSAYRYKQFYAMTEPVVSYDKRYEDTNLAFQFEITEKKVLVEITNIGAEDVVLDWPNASFIDSTGLKHPIVNDQTIFKKDAVKLKQSRLAPGAVENNIVVPADSQEQLEQWTWYVKPFFDLVDDSAVMNRNKGMKLIIPVRVAGEERRYSFQFTVTDVVPHRGLTLG